MRAREVLLAALALLGVWRAAADAEPYMAVREGLACNGCHVNITGGGKREMRRQDFLTERMCPPNALNLHKIPLDRTHTAPQFAGYLQDNVPLKQALHYDPVLCLGQQKE